MKYSILLGAALLLLTAAGTARAEDNSGPGILGAVLPGLLDDKSFKEGQQVQEQQDAGASGKAAADEAKKTEPNGVIALPKPPPPQRAPDDGLVLYEQHYHDGDSNTGVIHSESIAR